MPAPAMGTVRMTLRINDYEYIVRPMPLYHGCRNFVLSKREYGKETERYQVHESKNGTQCDCPDFRSRRAGGRDPDGCKHIKSLRVFYMVR